MSESMAFIGGVAVAGLAALLLLKGSGAPLQPNFAVTPQIQTPLVAPPMMAQPGQYGYMPQNPLPAPISPNTDQLRLDNERLKMQIENVQRENDQLKNQNQQLQLQLQNYNNLAQLNAQQQNQNATQTQQSQNPWWASPIIWAVGGMSLTIGGGVVMAGVLALFSPKSRPTRTVQVIHPYTGSSSPLVPMRRPEFLPPRTEARRVETPEYDDTY